MHTCAFSVAVWGYTCTRSPGFRPLHITHFHLPRGMWVLQLCTSPCSSPQSAGAGAGAKFAHQVPQAHGDVGPHTCPTQPPALHRWLVALLGKTEMSRGSSWQWHIRPWLLLFSLQGLSSSCRFLCFFPTSFPAGLFFGSVSLEFPSYPFCGYLPLKMARLGQTPTRYFCVFHLYPVSALTAEPLQILPARPLTSGGHANTHSIFPYFRKNQICS